MEKYNCPVFEAADVVGKKWAIVILQEIDLHGDKGFVFMQERMKKISSKVFTQRLTQLEKMRVIKRETFYENNLKRTKYSMTKKGQDLYKVILSLKNWKTKYATDGVDCRKKECVSCELF